MTTVLISGGFDPLHVGHLDLIEYAAGYGRVIVALNSDDWLFRKKGFVLMPFGDRARLLEAMSRVFAVSPVADADGTVCEALKRIRPAYFVNGGDREKADSSEDAVCRSLGIVQILGAGEKIRSSSKIARPA